MQKAGFLINNYLLLIISISISDVGKTQAKSRHYIRVDDTKVFDTEIIYTRVIGIQANSREIDIKQLLSQEVSPSTLPYFQKLVK